MPSVASGLLAPKVILQDVAPVADKLHRPAMFTGGGLAAGPAGAGLAAGELSDPPPNVMRSRRYRPQEAMRRRWRAGD